MSSKQSAASLRLLEAYIASLESGEHPEPGNLLRQCPEPDRHDLERAMLGARAIVEGHRPTYVSPKTLQATLSGLARVRERQRLLTHVNMTLDQLRSRALADPVETLRSAVGVPLELIQQAQATARQTAAAGLYRRGAGGATTRNRYLMEQQNRRLLETRLAAQATDLLEEHDFASPPTDLHRLAEQLGLVVREAPLEDLDGCLVAGDDCGAILINRHVANRQRRRFTLAHEIAHFVLHRWLRAFRDRFNELEAPARQQEELEADTLAAFLLIPPGSYPATYDAEIPRFERAHALVTTFDVSLTAALRRLVRASQHPSALVFSHAGRARWWVESSYLDYFLRMGLPPHPSSMAARLFDRGADGEQDATYLPLSAWLDVPEDEDADLMLWEESRRLPGGYVCSLISCVESPR